MDNEFLLIALLAGGIALMVVSTKAEPEHDKHCESNNKNRKPQKPQLNKFNLRLLV